MPIDTIYDTVAAAFAARMEEVFSTEDSLKVLWNRHLPGLPFDRTERWNTILLRELEAAWKQYGPVVKSPLTSADRLDLLDLLAHKLDYNIFSQVMLNLQNWGMLSYRVATAEEDHKAIAAKWAGMLPRPTDAGATMFKPALSPDQESFNHDLSLVKALKIIAAATPHVSFRVSPKGSTPALVDSANLSMLGVGSDRYLHLPPGIKVYYLVWETAPLSLDLDPEGKFRDPSLKYGFVSKSGGEVLAAVLAARRLTVAAFCRIRPGNHKVFLPRMTSLMIMTDEDPEMIRELVRIFQKGDAILGPWPMTLHEGQR